MELSIYTLVFFKKNKNEVDPRFRTNLQNNTNSINPFV